MLERISKIHKKILSGCYPNSKDLAYDLEVGIATISRDIEYMRDRMGAPIEYDAQNRGYYYSEEFAMPLYSVSPRDLQVLCAAKQLLMHYKNTPLYDEACDIIDLLSASAVKGGAGTMMNRIAVPPSPEASIDTKIWRTVCQAMQENRVIEFWYSGLWHPRKELRRVRPYQLLLEDSVCYLFGYAEERKAERLFVLTRMEELSLTKKTFTPPEDFDFANRCGGGKFGVFIGDKRTHFKVAFYNELRVWVKERKWADDQCITEETDRTVLSFSSTQLYKVMEWLLARGPNALPLEPNWFVEEWKNKVRKMAELVSKN